MLNEIDAIYTIEDVARLTQVKYGDIKAMLHLRLLTPMVKKSGKKKRNYFCYRDMLLVKVMTCFVESGIYRAMIKEITPQIMDGKKGMLTLCSHSELTIHINLDNFDRELRSQLT